MLSNIGYISEHAQTAVNFDQFQIFTLLLKLPILMCSCTVVIPPTCAVGKGCFIYFHCVVCLSVCLSDLAGFPAIGKQEAIYHSDTTVASQSDNVSILNRTI